MAQRVNHGLIMTVNPSKGSLEPWLMRTLARLVIFPDGKSLYEHWQKEMGGNNKATFVIEETVIGNDTFKWEINKFGTDNATMNLSLTMAIPTQTDDNTYVFRVALPTKYMPMGSTSRYSGSTFSVSERKESSFMKYKCLHNVHLEVVEDRYIDITVDHFKDLDSVDLSDLTYITGCFDITCYIEFMSVGSATLPNLTPQVHPVIIPIQVGPDGRIMPLLTQVIADTFDTGDKWTVADDAITKMTFSEGQLVTTGGSTKNDIYRMVYKDANLTAGRYLIQLDMTTVGGAATGGTFAVGFNTDEAATGNYMQVRFHGTNDTIYIDNVTDGVSQQIQVGNSLVREANQTFKIDIVVDKPENTLTVYVDGEQKCMYKNQNPPWGRGTGLAFIRTWGGTNEIKIDNLKVTTDEPVSTIK